MTSTQPLFFSTETPNAAASQMDSAVTSIECGIPDGAVKLTVQSRNATAGQRGTLAVFSTRRNPSALSVGLFRAS